MERITWRISLVIRIYSGFKKINNERKKYPLERKARLSLCLEETKEGEKFRSFPLLEAYDPFLFTDFSVSLEWKRRKTELTLRELVRYISRYYGIWETRSI